MEPLVSICIPSYKHPEFLERALQSIAHQLYANIEVVVSDDTPDESVKDVAMNYSSRLNLKYHHNVPALGTPANWNAALNRATGEFVMLLHHDDWLNNARAISQCVEAFMKVPEASIIFEKGITADRKPVYVPPNFPAHYFEEYYNQPFKLLVRNVIGPPSNLMMRSIVKERYRSPYRWLVDIEFYIRALQAGHVFQGVEFPFVSVGIHEHQMTNFFQSNKENIVAENILFAQQYFSSEKPPLFVYDHYWRLLRKSSISSTINTTVYGAEYNSLPPFISHIQRWQSKVPKRYIRGALSKVLMSLSYLFL